MNAARALKEAAEVINNSPTALQLRYLQTLNFIAAERGSTILFPIPMDVLGGMAGNWGAVSYNYTCICHMLGMWMFVEFT